MRALFFCGEFLLHIPWRLLFLIRRVSLTHPVLFSFLSAESLFNIPCCFIFIWGVSLTHPMLTLFLYGEILWHIPRWRQFYLGSFSYTSRAYIIFIWGVSLTHPVLALILSTDFLLHISCWFHFTVGVSLIHPVLASFLSADFLLHIPRWLHFYAGSFSYTSHADYFYVGIFSYTSRAAFTFMLWVFLTHPVLSWFLCREFLLQIPSWLFFFFL